MNLRFTISKLQFPISDFRCPKAGAAHGDNPFDGVDFDVDKAWRKHLFGLAVTWPDIAHINHNACKDMADSMEHFKDWFLPTFRDAVNLPQQKTQPRPHRRYLFRRATGSPAFS